MALVSGLELLEGISDQTSGALACPASRTVLWVIMAISQGVLSLRHIALKACTIRTGQAFISINLTTRGGKNQSEDEGAF